MAKDINNKEIVSGYVVEIKGAYSKSDNGLWYVDHSSDRGVWLHKLNKDMSKSKGKNTCTGWPLRSYSNNRYKRCEINEYNEANATIEMLCPYVEPAPKPVSNEIKILKKGIRKGDKYYPCYYWKNSDGTVTVYAKDYGYDGLPSGLGNVINESNGQIDYFEKSHCYLKEGDRYYNEVMAVVTKHS